MCQMLSWQISGKHTTPCSACSHLSPFVGRRGIHEMQNCLIIYISLQCHVATVILGVGALLSHALLLQPVLQGCCVSAAAPGCAVTEAI